MRQTEITIWNIAIDKELPEVDRVVIALCGDKPVIAKLVITAGTAIWENLKGEKVHGVTNWFYVPKRRKRSDKIVLDIGEYIPAKKRK